MTVDVSDDEAKETNPAEQLVELLLYAPVGLLYEYQEVLPKLIKRGKSQVQLARVMGQMAASRGQSDPAAAAGDLVGLASGVLNRLVTEIASQLGLAPPSGEPAPRSTSEGREPTGTSRAGSEPAALPEGAPTDEARPPPIALYDELTAREIIALLGDLDPEQRERIRVYETGNRNRKTILAKLDRLDP